VLSYGKSGAKRFRVSHNFNNTPTGPQEKTGKLIPYLLDQLVTCHRSTSIQIAMMILTMNAQEAPTTTNSDSVGEAFAQTKCVDTNDSNLMTTAGSFHSLTSTCSESTSCTMPSDSSKVKKGVSFGLQQTAYFSPEQILSKEERKSECWYSEAELNVSRDEARMAIQALHQQLQLDAAVAAAAANSTPANDVKKAPPTAPVLEGYGSWVMRCPDDQTKIVCLRGIEKYADAAAKYAGQKRLVHSVLQQQSDNNEDVLVSLVSQTLSKPFKEVARYYAMKSAEELDLLMKHEEEQAETERRQREEVATVLLLIMGQENKRKIEKQQQTPQKTRLEPSSSKLQETSPVVSPHGFKYGKRSFTSSPFSESRNVKPCIRTISDCL